MSFLNKYFFSILFFFSINASSQTRIKRVCINPNLEDIVIYLDSITDPCDSFQRIDVYARQSNLVPFFLLDSIFNKSISTYIHPNGASIGNTWSYYFVYRYLCSGDTLISDTNRIDLTQPSITTFDSVSFDPVSSKIIIGWTENNAIDKMGYKLWRSTGNNNIPIDSTNKTSYLDLNSNPNNTPLSYRLSVYDSCLNQSVISNVHTSMYLQFNGNPCNNVVYLNHNAYIGNTVSHYDLYQKIKPELDYKIISSQTSPYQNHQMHLQSGDTVDIFVRAHFTNGYSSRSNSIQVIVSDSFTQLYENQISSISWLNNNQYILTFDETYSNQIDSAQLLYFNLTADQTIKKDLFQNLSSTGLKLSGYIDTLPHFFRLKVRDICNRWYTNPNYQTNHILKQKETDDPEKIELNFTRTLSEPDFFQLFYAADLPTINQTLIYQGTDTTYQTDYVIEEPKSCYQSLASKSGNHFISNPICLRPIPSYYIPSAISPIGKNKEFYIFGTGIDRNQSQLQIYNRWGQMIYDADLNKGWNGTYQNEPVSEGLYLFTLKIVFSNGEHVFDKGSITVLY